MAMRKPTLKDGLKPKEPSTPSGGRKEENVGEEDAKARNGEAKFAFPEDDTGVGYYFEGEQVSPDEFSWRVAEKADRIRAEEVEKGEG